MRLLDASGANQADSAAGKTWARGDERYPQQPQSAGGQPHHQATFEEKEHRADFLPNRDPVETKHLVTFPYAQVGERDDTERGEINRAQESEDPRNIAWITCHSLILVNDYDAKERTLQGVVSAGADGGEPGPGPMGSPKKGKGIGMQGPADAGATMPDRLKKGRAQEFRRRSRGLPDEAAGGGVPQGPEIHDAKRAVRSAPRGSAQDQGHQRGPLRIDPHRRRSR